MGKRLDFMLFPGGKNRAMTFSYDDGVVQDRRLVELFNRYHVKGTFNLNTATLGIQAEANFGGKHMDISKVSPEEVATLYEGHEVGGHSLCHSSLPNIGTSLAMHELVEDRISLEKLSGKMVRFFAYPFGTYNEDVKQLVRMAGYMGARTVVSTHTFEIPQDFMEWHATCHHNDPQLMELARQFVEAPPFFPMLFYVWGHAYEFDDNDNWSVMEGLVAYLAEHKDKIWFATNGEILEYLNAYHRLEYSVDGSLIYNPSAIDVTIRTGMEQTELLKAGCCTRVADTPL